jgi:hypothetical protein
MKVPEFLFKVTATELVFHFTRYLRHEQMVELAFVNEQMIQLAESSNA